MLFTSSMLSLAYDGNGNTNLSNAAFVIELLGVGLGFGGAMGVANQITPTPSQTHAAGAM